MSDFYLGSTPPDKDPSTPTPPTWTDPSNLVDGKLPTAGYVAAKPHPNPPNTPVADYPANAREFPKKVSPLELWYRGSEPPGCIISHGVVTSDNKPIEQST
jgi:hypothetical protein